MTAERRTPPQEKIVALMEDLGAEVEKAKDERDSVRKEITQLRAMITPLIGSVGLGGPWQIDRRVPLALIFSVFVTIGGQTLAGVWWAAAISHRMDTAAERITSLERYQIETTKVDAADAVKIGRMEEQLGLVQRTLDRMMELLGRRTGPAGNDRPGGGNG